MSLIVIILMVLAYIAAVALLLVYVVVFVAPRFASANSDLAGDFKQRAEEYLAEQELGHRQPHRDPMDAVCGNTASLTGLHTWPFHGRVYYFCSESCQKRFARNPGTYVLPSGKPRPRLRHLCNPR